jgi:hypothetical protein
MEALTGIYVGMSSGLSWNEMYNSAKEIRWRRAFEEVETPYESLRLKNYRSKIGIVIFQ